MNKADFIEKLDTAKDTIDIQKIDEILTHALSPAGEKLKGAMNLIIAMEEFAECTQQLSKVLRGKSDKYELLEETADALIGIRYIQIICDISDEELKKAVNVKIERLKEKLEVQGDK